MLWVLADKLGMPSLQNVALKAIAKIFDKYQRIVTQIFPYIENNTAADSPLRQYMLTICAANFDPEDFAPPEIPYQLLREFGVYMLKRKLELDSPEWGVSDYLVKED